MPSSTDRPLWYLVETGCRPAADNMAIDEVLLEQCGHLQHPLLRFYSWSQAAATFGYSQRIATVERLTDLRPLIRRPTGGGLVPHAADWTYSIVVPPSDPWYSLRANESYRRVHQWMAEAFARLGFHAELSSRQNSEGLGQCFVGAEESDLLYAGRKIAGAAQRRNRRGLLIQGSVQPPANAPPRSVWQASVCEAASCEWSFQWEPLTLDALTEQRVAQLAREKYSHAEYNRRR